MKAVEKGGEEENTRVERVDGVQQATAAIPNDNDPLIAPTQQTPPPILPAPTCERPMTWNAPCDVVNTSPLPTTTELGEVEDNSKGMERMEDELKAVGIRNLQVTPSQAVAAPLRQRIQEPPGSHREHNGRP